VFQHQAAHFRFSTAWQTSWTRPVGFEIAGEEVESGSASKTNISIKIHAAQVAPAKLTDYLLQTHLKDRSLSKERFDHTA